jgi:hypothetical protein
MTIREQLIYKLEEYGVNEAEFGLYLMNHFLSTRVLEEAVNGYLEDELGIDVWCCEEDV